MRLTHLPTAGAATVQILDAGEAGLMEDVALHWDGTRYLLTFSDVTPGDAGLWLTTVTPAGSAWSVEPPVRVVRQQLQPYGFEPVFSQGPGGPVLLVYRRAQLPLAVSRLESRWVGALRDGDACANAGECLSGSCVSSPGCAGLTCCGSSDAGSAPDAGSTDAGNPLADGGLLVAQLGLQLDLSPAVPGALGSLRVELAASQEVRGATLVLWAEGLELELPRVGDSHRLDVDVPPGAPGALEVPARPTRSGVVWAEGELWRNGVLLARAKRVEGQVHRVALGLGCSTARTAGAAAVGLLAAWALAWRHRPRRFSSGEVRCPGAARRASSSRTR